MNKIKEILRRLVNDYKSISDAVHYSFKCKIPEWVILIYYIIMLPVGLILYPFLKIASKIYIQRIFKKYD